MWQKLGTEANWRPHHAGVELVKDTAAVNGVVAALVLVWLLKRQLSARPVRERSWLPIALVIVGACETISYAHQFGMSARSATVLATSVGLGVLLAVGRAYTVRLWDNDATTMQQGNYWTAALWIIALAQHLALEALLDKNLAAVTLLAYFGLSMLAQRLTLLQRAHAEPEVERC